MSAKQEECKYSFWYSGSIRLAIDPESTISAHFHHTWLTDQQINKFMFWYQKLITCEAKIAVSF